jgi:hypothetical protein
LLQTVSNTGSQRYGHGGIAPLAGERQQPFDLTGHTKDRPNVD